MTETPGFSAFDTGAPLAADPAALGAGAVQAGAAADAPDAAQLLQMIQAMQAKVAGLEAEKRTAGAAPLLGTAESLRNVLAEHASGKTTGAQDADAHADTLRLADDLVEAAGNAVTSGDPGSVGQIAQRLGRAMRKAAPGPGDHNYWRQAESFLLDVPDLADQLTPPPAAAAPAVGSSRAPATVVAGSVVG